MVQYKLEEKDNLSGTDILYSKLGKLVSEGKINEAENLLFDENGLSDIVLFIIDKSLEQSSFNLLHSSFIIISKQYLIRKLLPI